MRLWSTVVSHDMIPVSGAVEALVYGGAAAMVAIVSNSVVDGGGYLRAWR